MSALEPAELSRIALTTVLAIASDDILAGRLVLKGGNALQLVHRVGSRASGDVDFSMPGDISLDTITPRLERALASRFEAAGYYVFDFSVTPRPQESGENAQWGGYSATFKALRQRDVAAIEAAELDRLTKKKKKNTASLGLTDQERLDVHRRNAGRAHSIDISKFEYCEGRQEIDIQGYRCLVYSPAMIAAEKFRAICQQMPGYSLRQHPAARARDFYDIHALGTSHVRVDIGEHLRLVEEMFKAKEVPLTLLKELANQRDFHLTDWDKVRQAVSTPLEPFDYYFDYVVNEAKKLEPLWKP